nr:hypothetical protein [Tanacetum cinerariifolium]
MNYLEEQTYGEAMINSIQNDLWDALESQMRGSEYGEQDRKAAILYEYETFKAIEGEQLLDTYLRYLQVINDLKKCGYKKDNYELNYKFLNNLQPEWKQYGILMRQTKNLMDINIYALYNIQNQGDVNDALGYKKKAVVVTSDPLALIAEKTKIIALLAKAFNRRKFYSKPINNNLRTLSTSQSANKKQEFVKSDDKKVEKKDDEKKRDMRKVKCYNCKKEGHFAKDCKKAKAFNRKKFYSKLTNNNLRTSSASILANKKQEYVKSDDKKEEKKVEEKKKDMSKVKCYNCKKEGHFAKDWKKAKVKDYEYYKTKMFLAKKDKDEQVLLAKDHAWMESSNHNESYITHNDSEDVAKLINQMIKEFDKKIAKYQKSLEKANRQNKDFETQNKDLHDKYEVLKYQANTFEEKNHKLNEQIKVLIEKKADLLAQTDVLKEKLKVKHVVIDTHAKYNLLEKEMKISELEECVCKKVLEIEKCLGRFNDSENKLHKIGQTNQTIHMIMHSKDMLYNGRKGIGYENLNYFCKEKELKPALYDERVINLGYTLMFVTHSNEALEIKKFKRARENKIEFAYDYGNLNTSYANEKINFLNDYFQEIINPDFEKIDSSFQQMSSLKPYVLTVILEKIIIDLVDEVMNTLSSVRRPKPSGAMRMWKGSSNTVKAYLSFVNHSYVNENVKRYSRKNLMACNNSDTRSAFNCNNARNSLCNARINASVDVNDLFVFDDVSIRKSHVSKIPFRKKPSASLNVPSRSKLNKSEFACNNVRNAFCNSYDVDVNDLFVFDDVSIRKSQVSKMNFRKKPSAALNIRNNLKKYLSRNVLKWLLKLELLAEPVAKWIPRIIQICLWINDSRCSKHMMGNRSLLTNFVEKFLRTVRFRNNNFAVIAGYRDVVIGFMTIKRVYYLEGLGFFFAITSNSLSCLLAKASSLQFWLWHQRLSHLNFSTINNIVKNNIVRGLPKMKFKKDHLCSACEQGKIHQKHHKSKMAFASNQPLYLLHMDLYGSMHIERINRKRYVLVVVDDYLQYTWVFFLHSKDEASEISKSLTTNVETSNNEGEVFHKVSDLFQGESSSSSINDDVQKMASKQFSLEPGLSNLNETGKSSNLSVSQVYEASKIDLKILFQDFYDEYFDSSKIMKSSTTNVETPINDEVFHEVSESFQGESSSSSLNDDVQQSPEEVIPPQTNTQSIPIDMVPNGDEASTSHNVFNERLEDAYFDASTSFHEEAELRVYFYSGI